MSLELVHLKVARKGPNTSHGTTNSLSL